MARLSTYIVHNISYIDNNIHKQPWLVSKYDCSSQKPLLTNGIWTRDHRFRSLGFRPRPTGQQKIRVYYLSGIAREEPDSPAVSALGVRSRKLSNALNGQTWDGWPNPYHLELLRASEGTLSRWSRLHLQSLAPTNPHWARVVGYDPFSLWVIHKKGLCPSSGDINRMMMIYKELSITIISITYID
jgi:hypothetical protein